MTKRALVILLSGAALLLLAVTFEVHAAITRPRAKIGQVAPAFSSMTVSGKNFSFPIGQKEPVLLDFFATWCGPCQQEMPALNRFAQASRGKVKVVMIDRGDSKVMIRRFIKKYGVASEITVLYNQPDKLSQIYEVSGQPEAVFINQNGKVLYHTEGPLRESELLQWAHETGTSPSYSN
ncbi:TlpA disulfide reductase family protein [Alicyclobacillus sp. SO9]|uniref:TlpA family protein disulfide reductase n=1 Tax=Alicyclobacillus sp. SO9 TaxID=2665646 RepID=UPI0018E7DFA7|nr:TlpA disulfide reductase family protein [Alicyclobacillus sp. SO9]QQE78159.1 TlpA family protein disulfide reductase [Alicyclobacillus sp. SO9]